MKINIIVKPESKEEEVERIDGNNFVVKVREQPVKGRANEAVLGALAAYFNLAKSNIKIVSGFTSKKKVIELDLRDR